MANGRDTRLIKRIRNEILVALKVVYPAALQAKQLVRSLIVLFPTIEFDHLKRDLHYLLVVHPLSMSMPPAASIDKLLRFVSPFSKGGPAWGFVGCPVMTVCSTGFSAQRQSR